MTHPAAIRSRNLIVDSLLELMKSTMYDKITIKDLTESALLTRRTFYAHFKTKDDVLNYKIKGLCDELVHSIKNKQSTNPKELALMYFSFWINHKKLLQLMKGHHLLPIVFQNFDQSIKDIRVLFGCDFSNSNQQYVDYSSAFFTGILSSIMSKWIDTGANESAEELVELLIKITKKFSSNFT